MLFLPTWSLGEFYYSFHESYLKDRESKGMQLLQHRVAQRLLFNRESIGMNRLFILPTH